MKQEVSPAVIAIVAVVIVAILGFVAWHRYGGNPNDSNITPQQLKEMQQQKMLSMTAKRDQYGRPIPGTEANVPLKPGR